MSTRGYIFAVEDKRCFCFGEMRGLMGGPLDDDQAYDVRELLRKHSCTDAERSKLLVDYCQMEDFIRGLIWQYAMDGRESCIDIPTVVNVLAFVLRHSISRFFVCLDEIAFQLINEDGDKRVIWNEMTGADLADRMPLAAD